MNLVAYSVSGFRVNDAVFGGYGLKVLVVVGVLETHLDGVVVHVAYGKLGFHLF